MNNLPDPDDNEIVQMLAAQSVVLDHHDELEKEYKEKILELSEKYDVEVPL